ncbi:hypothetical protein [Streptomyces sp. cg35]|uniref:hypothetical protein n=1 Tax=Streptomyces sp. cg35 TaxID=3421650 RepID=UPI003D1846BF
MTGTSTTALGALRAVWDKTAEAVKTGPSPYERSIYVIHASGHAEMLFFKLVGDNLDRFQEVLQAHHFAESRRMEAQLDVETLTELLENSLAEAAKHKNAYHWLTPPMLQAARGHLVTAFGEDIPEIPMWEVFEAPISSKGGAA